MEKKEYTKAPLTFDEQLAHLQSKGLVIRNYSKALQKLSIISYYPLSGYWYPFRKKDSQGIPTDQFHPGTTFDQVIELYEFDRKLRIYVMDAIERIEVAVRTCITYHLGHQYGAFGHAKATYFHQKFDHSRWLENIEKETSRSKEEFIRHYRDRYNGFPKLPIWMLTEVMSFGSLSFCYSGLIQNQLKGIEDKKAISNQFGVNHKRFGIWLHTLTYVRNVCAHHSRLWNRQLAIKPDKSKESLWQPPMTPRNDRIFYVLLILHHLLKQSGNGNDWRERITELIEPIVSVDFYRDAMGVPKDWENHPLWK